MALDYDFARLLSEGRHGEAGALLVRALGPKIRVPGVARIVGSVMGRLMFGETHPYFASDVMVEAEAEVAGAVCLWSGARPPPMISGWREALTRGPYLVPPGPRRATGETDPPRPFWGGALMGHISRTIHVEATPEQVFDLISNPARFREWQVPAAEVKDITGTPGTVGLGWTTASTFAGRKMEGHMSVTAVERPRSFELTGTGTFAATVRGRFEPAAGGTDVTIENEYEMPLGFIGDAANKLFFEKSFAESWDKSLAKFKALVEAEAPAHV